MIKSHCCNELSVNIGKIAERDACQFLQKHGLILKEKNFIAINPAGKKCGEIDLIMMDKNLYVFVEVKLRKQQDHGDVLELITTQKQARIKLATKYYLTQHGLWDRIQSRFDVIGISIDVQQQNRQTIVWIKNAFGVQY